MNIDQLTNKEDYSIPSSSIGIRIGFTSSEDENRQEEKETPSRPVKKQRVKRRRKTKRVLYDYRKDPRYDGLPLEFDVPLNNEDGTLVNFAELVKNHLDEQEARKRELGESTENESNFTEALESGSQTQTQTQDEDGEDLSENLDDDSPISGGEDIQDEFLLGLLRKAKAGEYVRILKLLISSSCI